MSKAKLYSTGVVKAKAAASVTGLTRQFGAQKVLDGLDLSIQAGEFVALLGRSGSGKTTLLRTLGGSIRLRRGAQAYPPRAPWCFRNHGWCRGSGFGAMSLWGSKAGQAIRGNWRMPRWRKLNLGTGSKSWPATLSGGEAQRTALARALVRGARASVARRAFAALDALTRIRMQRLVEALWERHKPAVLLVTHDVDEAILLSDRVLILAEGRIETEIRIDLPRQRHHGQAGFAALRQRLLSGLGVETEIPVVRDTGAARLRLIEREIDHLNWATADVWESEPSKGSL